MKQTQKESSCLVSSAACLKEISTFLFSLDMRTPPSKQMVVYQSAIVTRAGNNKEVLLQGFKMARELGATIV